MGSTSYTRTCPEDAIAGLPRRAREPFRPTTAVGANTPMLRRERCPKNRQPWLYPIRWLREVGGKPIFALAYRQSRTRMKTRFSVVVILAVVASLTAQNVTQPAGSQK